MDCYSGEWLYVYYNFAAGSFHKETLQQTFVMQYNITFTYSMFIFSDRML